MRTFAHTYQLCGGKNKRVVSWYQKSLLKKIESYVIANFPGHKLYYLTDYYKEKIISNN